MYRLPFIQACDLAGTVTHASLSALVLRVAKLGGWGPKAISEADFAKKVDAIALASRDNAEGLGHLATRIAFIGESVSDNLFEERPELLEAPRRRREYAAPNERESAPGHNPRLGSARLGSARLGDVS
jgi:hypothetical protein